MNKAEEKLRIEYLQASKELSNARHQSAANLDKKVMEELPPLKMDKANFVTQIEELPETIPLFFIFISPVFLQIIQNSTY